MDVELDDDDGISIRDEDKTRQFAVPVRGPVIDDLGDSDETTASALPVPEVTPFSSTSSSERPIPRAAPPAPRESRRDESTTAPEPRAPSAQHAGSPREDVGPEEASQPMPSNPPELPKLPPVPTATTEPAPETKEPSVPTIVVKPIVHEPSAPRAREQTVVVKRDTRPAPKKKRSPAIMLVLVAALVVVASALAFAGIRRTLENQARQREIEQRVEQLRRQQGG